MDNEEEHWEHRGGEKQVKLGRGSMSLMQYVANTANLYFLCLIVTLPNSLVPPGEKSSHVLYQSIFLLVEQLHFGIETKNKQTCGTSSAREYANAVTCQAAPRRD